MGSQPIRILQVGMSPNYGGTEAVVYEIYRHLDRSEVQFDFLNVYDIPLAREEWLKSCGANIYWLKLQRRKGLFKYRRNILRFFREHSSEFSVVVCNVQCLDQIDMARFAHRFGIKTVVYVHNSGHGVPPSLLARVAICFNKVRYRRFTDLAVAGSQNGAEWGFGRKRACDVTIVKQGIDVERFRFSQALRDAFRKKHNLADEEMIFGSVGRMDSQKNQLFLIDVYQELSVRMPHAKFILVGQGPLEAEIREKVAKAGLIDRLEIISRVEDMVEFYSGIDCFILPSRFEGLGMVLLEAQCCGLPCFFSKKVIPDSASITDLAYTIPLEMDARYWAETVLATPRTSVRDTYSDFLLQEGWDIKETSREYVQLLKGIVGC